MSNLFKKANLPYLVASSLATLTLIASLGSVDKKYKEGEKSGSLTK